MSKFRESEKDTSGERIIGEIPAIAKLAVGHERLQLFLTTSRIIIAHAGKRGAGALATMSLFGRLGGALEDLLKGSRESLKRRGTEELTPQEILDADRDNFSINYQDVVSVELDDSAGPLSLIVLTKQEKLRFLTSTSLGSVMKLFEPHLGDRLRARRTGG